MTYSGHFKIKFLLYTRANTALPQVVTKTPLSIKHSHFSSARKTKFMIHGYQSCHSHWMINMAQAILTRVSLDHKHVGVGFH
ncbi:hypothetical protein DPMN_027808 [Dreissena polymorpha]|uniref:Lipase domain-containing protein n=1 Tax=Dreissena polymorpha TaxID=45954 RepID=A0A9D4RFK5_DREPO|nr:hypothetical protein DPMN_027808 [Dreissena polymorpha]